MALILNLQTHIRYNHKWSVYDQNYIYKVFKDKQERFTTNGIFILLRTLKDIIKDSKDSLGLSPLHSLGLNHNTLKASLFIVQGLTIHTTQFISYITHHT